MSNKYKEIYQRSINDAEGFWSDVSKDVFWYKKPTKILNSNNPPFYKWFSDGITNTCYNAIDLHVKNGNRYLINLMLIYHVQGVPTKMKVRSCHVDKYDCNLVAEKMSNV